MHGLQEREFVHNIMVDDRTSNCIVLHVEVYVEAHPPDFSRFLYRTSLKSNLSKAFSNASQTQITGTTKELNDSENT